MEPAPQLAAQFEEYLSVYEDIFVRNDCIGSDGQLLCDGIGDWDDEAHRYTYWGQGLAAEKLNHTRSHTYLVYGGDSGLRLGRRIALLSLLYDRAQRNGQPKLAQTHLNRLYLALQAYRRLDMTANRWLHTYQTRCLDASCPTDAHPRSPRFDGYSGFFTRDDAFWDLPKSEARAALPDHISADHCRGKLTDVQQKLRNGHADYKAANFPCYFPQLLDGHLFNSQDQIIGLMHGLAFVKRLIPSDATVRLPGQQVGVLNIAQRIAEGLYRKAGQCGRMLRIPSCTAGCDSPSHGTGDNVKAFYLGLDYIYQYITGQEGDSGFADRAIFALSQPVSTGSKSRVNSIFNTRLFLKLQVAGRLNVQCDMLQHALDIRYYTAPLEYSILHDRPPKVYDACADEEVTYSDVRQAIVEALNSVQGSSLPIYFDDSLEKRFAVNSTISQDLGNMIWCSGGPLESNEFDCRNAWHGVLSPEQWLYMYVLLY